MKQQRCSQCDALTGRCEDDTLMVREGDPLCEGCYESYPECDGCGCHCDGALLRCVGTEEDGCRFCPGCRA